MKIKKTTKFILFTIALFFVVVTFIKANNGGDETGIYVLSVTTSSPVTNITQTTAHGTGTTVVNPLGNPANVAGLVWSTNPNPDISLSTKTTDGYNWNLLCHYR